MENNNSGKDIPMPTIPGPNKLEHQPPFNPYQQAPPYQYQQPYYPAQPNIIFQPAPLSDVPCPMMCKNCNRQIITRIVHSVGGGTWLMVGAICLAGLIIPFLWCGCQFIPCCIKSCKDATHYCPNCNAYLGKHQPF